LSADDDDSVLSLSFFLAGSHASVLSLSRKLSENSHTRVCHGVGVFTFSFNPLLPLLLLLFVKEHLSTLQNSRSTNNNNNENTLFSAAASRLGIVNEIQRSMGLYDNESFFSVWSSLLHFLSLFFLHTFFLSRSLAH
jgi:hypothetical protein